MADLLSSNAPGQGSAYEYKTEQAVGASQRKISQLNPVDVLLDDAANDVDTHEFEAILQESREEGHICLVCIDTVTVSDPIWQCGR